MTGGGWTCRWAIRGLARITTTAPTPSGQPLLPKGWVQDAHASGWTVRLAGPRNFILWRNDLSRDDARRILVLPHRSCGLSVMEFRAVAAELALRCGLPDFPQATLGEARRYWIEQAERRLVQRIAPVSGRLR